MKGSRDSEGRASSGSRRQLGLATATLIVVASMIGTGVFTTTGVLLQDIGSPAVVLVGWALGGLIAMCGAWTYGELLAAFPSNGGEYRLLGKLFHPAAGFVAGWISLLVGFSAPIAASARAFGEYVHAIWPGVPVLGAGVLLIASASLLHASHVKGGARAQNLFALLKAALIIGFIVLGVGMVETQALLPTCESSMGDSLLSPSFAVGLIFISFAYSGWNGAAYVAGEVRAPTRTLPRALALGTGFVTLLYVALNAVFLASAPPSDLAGKVEVGHIAATRLLGGDAGRFISGLIALALVSSASAMIMVGPRVYEAMGEDYRRLRFLRFRPERGGPATSIALQALLATVMLLTASFGALLTYIGVTLSISTALTVGGVLVLRRRQDRPGSRPGPGRTSLPAVLFIGFSIWMIVFTLVERPLAVLCSGLTIAGGLAVYGMVRNSRTPAHPPELEGDSSS